MELSDRDSGDGEITAELYTYPIVYRAIIHRIDHEALATR
jgi:hypothetical protein